jgi:hypothetical protein
MNKFALEPHRSKQRMFVVLSIDERNVRFP